MRDMVPHFCELMDQAVVLTGGLDKPPERNFIRKHIEEQMAELRADTANELNEAEMRRAAASFPSHPAPIRFRSRPGSGCLSLGYGQRPRQSLHQLGRSHLWRRPGRHGRP